MNTDKGKTYYFVLNEPFTEVHLTLSDEATYESLNHKPADGGPYLYAVGFQGLDGMSEGEEAVVFMNGTYKADSLPQWSEREADGSYRKPDLSKGESVNYTPLGRQAVETISSMIKALKAA